jgi:hypothetical protein
MEMLEYEHLKQGKSDESASAVQELQDPSPHRFQLAIDSLPS